jgi:hypothetical protein
MINWIRYFLVVSALTKDFCSGKGLKIGWKIRGFFVWHYTCHLNLVVYTVKLSAKWGGIHISAKWIFFAISPRFFPYLRVFPRSPRLWYFYQFSHISALFSHISAFLKFYLFSHISALFYFSRGKKRGDMGKKLNFKNWLSQKPYENFFKYWWLTQYVC